MLYNFRFNECVLYAEIDITANNLEQAQKIAPINGNG
jgi:hypothetical protein